MLILMLGIAIAALVVFSVLRVKHPRKHEYLLDVHDFFTGMAWAFGAVALGMIITICCITPKIATASTIDDKIAMYQEENAAI